MDRLGAVADESREVVDVEGVARLGHQSDPRPEPGVHQVLADGADREEHRDRRVALVGGAVADRSGCAPRAAPPARPRAGAR